jgi:hypothetical protein
VSLTGCGDDGNSRLDELPSDDALATGDLTTDEFAEVVQIIGDGDVRNETIRAAASAVELFLDDVAVAALTGSAHDFDRRDLVNFAEEVSRDETAHGYLHESIVTWGNARSSEQVPDPDLLAGPDLSPADAPRFPEDVLESAAMITTAFQQGIDEAEGSDTFGTEFRDDVVAALRIDHVSALDDHGVVDVLAERDLLESQESYSTTTEYLQSVVILVYGTDPFDDLDSRIVAHAADSDATSAWRTT